MNWYIVVSLSDSKMELVNGQVVTGKMNESVMEETWLEWNELATMFTSKTMIGTIKLKAVREGQKLYKKKEESSTWNKGSIKYYFLGMDA